MLNEINAALDHLVTLLHPSVDSDCFKQQVQSALLARYDSVWFPSDPSRGSASRVILWHGHGGGEGQDEEIQRACYANLLKKETGEESGAFFSSPFTLWIDPGCVAIRLGHGPGIYLSSAVPSLQVKIIYNVETSRAKTVSSFSPPIVTLSPSTPALNGEHSSSAWSGASSFNNNRRMPLTMQNFHARSTSNSSMSSTFTTSRSTSHGSSSHLSSNDDLERCPSLTNTSARDSDSELSIEDMIDSGCYKNFDIIDDEEDEGVHGDETVGRVIFGSEDEEDDEDAGNVTLSAEELKSSAPVSIVNYDGGNVGVLGGGIRLGGGVSTKPKKMPTSTTKAPSPFASAYHPLSMQTGPWQVCNTIPPYNASLYSFENSLGFSMPSYYQHSNSNNPVDGFAIPLNRRVRSRGRRSRGRGAGRAARRQAAALQALSDAEKNLAWPSSSSPQDQEQGAVDGDDEKDNETDERIMALVRQRADQVAKDLVKRHLDQERRKAATKLHEIQQGAATPMYPQQQQQLMSNKMAMPHSTVAYTHTTTFYPAQQPGPPYHQLRLHPDNRLHHLHAYPQAISH